MQASGKRCLVIGANGFIGRYLTAALKVHSDVVGVYHKNTDGLSGDIKNWPVHEIANAGIEFDQVYITSAYIPSSAIDGTEREKMFRGNVELTDRICAAYHKSRIIFCSSVSVYPAKEAAINEFDQPSGINEYGISKAWGERIISQLDNYAILRFSSVYGEGMKLNSIIPAFILQALQHKEIRLFGTGARKQNYIHVSDAVNFLEAAGNYSGNSGFLAVSGESVSNKYLADCIAEKLNCKVVFEGEDTSPSFLYDNAYTTGILGYRTGVSLDTGLDNLIKWIKEKYL